MVSYLVTGGCGFIGSHLARALIDTGARVRILDDLSTGRRDLAPAEADLCIGSIADPIAVDRAISGVDGCFHLAAIASVSRSVEDWWGCHAINVGGTVRVFESAAKLGVPVVYASSAAVYGDAAQLPITEDSPTRPLTPYGVDKLACELHAAAGGRGLGLRSFGLRFFNVYGPNQDPKSPYSGVISIFVSRLLRGLPLTIYGDGKQVRDFVHVSDVVSHLLAAMPMTSPQAPVLNVCRGVPITIGDLAHTVMTVAGRGGQLCWSAARPGDIRQSVGSPAQAASLFGFQAVRPLQDGLAGLL